MLVFSDVRKSYRNLEVLKGLTLSVPRGSLFGLMGQNGAGKTTLAGKLGKWLRETRRAQSGSSVLCRTASAPMTICRWPST